MEIGPPFTSGCVLMELMAPYQVTGCNFYIKNWYTSPSLYEKLLQANANVLGTVRLHSKHKPEELKKENSD
jgi:hypothetical protein